MGMIVTTYTMRHDVLKRLCDAEDKTKTPKLLLLMLCMRRMLAEHTRYLRDTQRIEYQQRFNEETHLPILKKRVKIRFGIKEYNFFQDMRKFFSRSISLCIAIAVFEYLDEVVESVLRDGAGAEADNYPFDFYAIIENCIGNVRTFRIWWGSPKDIELLLNH